MDHYVAGTILSPGNTSVNKDKVLALIESTFQCREKNKNLKKKYMSDITSDCDVCFYLGLSGKTSLKR